MPPGEALLSALDIYENKVSLSREQLINRWKSPSVAADSILVRDGKLLLVRRGNEPYRGCYALPGGIVDEWETLEQCALRELMEETGIRGSIRGILGVYSDPDRDPRVRMISAAYVIDYIEGEPRAGDDASAALFFPLSDLPGLAFDHDRVVEEFRRSRYFRPQD
ncbi:MAG: NUDIX hydrolase [Thermoplasmata archaeon]|nr:NUDIX hydrolase [Candidatus Sysuiplasma acidicola]